MTRQTLKTFQAQNRGHTGFKVSQVDRRLVIVDFKTAYLINIISARSLMGFFQILS